MDKARMRKKLWAYYGRYYRGSFRLLLLSVVAVSCQAVLLVPIAFLVRYAFEDAIPKHEVGGVLSSGAVILGLYIANGGLTIWTRYTILKITKQAIGRLREDLLTKVYTLPRSLYIRANLGQWHSVIVQDSERLDVVSNALLALFLPSLGACLALSTVLLILNPFLFALLVCIIPVLMLLNRLLGRHVRRRVAQFRESFARFSEGALFVLQRLDLTIAQAAEQSELARQRIHMDETRRTSLYAAWLQATYGVLNSTVITAAGVMILIVGGIAVGSGAMTIGAMISFYVTAALLRDAAVTIMQALPQMIGGEESLRALYEAASISSTHPYHGTRPIAFRGKVALESICFSYGERPLFQDFSLTVAPGEIVALTGSNGVGKSTITYLLLGFYRPHQGRVLADDQPLDELDLPDLRRQIGVVMQEAPVFGGTVAENIAYGYAQATPERIRQAASLSEADDFISRLPQGYDTPVGEGGAMLSGGQRQCLALARALLRRPALLILDEPSNHLDAYIVKRLLNNLKHLDYAPAIIIISHNPDVVGACNTVYNIGGGRPSDKSVNRLLQQSPAAPEPVGRLAV